MNAKEFISLLGSTWDSENLQKMLSQCGFKAPKPPKIDPDSLNGSLINKKLGLQFTFTYLKDKLILHNVRMFGENKLGYTPFKGELLSGINLSHGLKDVQAIIGKPAATNPKIAIGRWDLTGYCLAIIFDLTHSHIKQFSIQLPVAVDKK